MTIENLLSVLTLVITACLGIWAIYQVRFNHRLERELHRLNVELDQDIQRLYRARDAIIAWQKAGSKILAFNRQPNASFNVDLLVNALGDVMAGQSEIKGLAYAINDKKLIELAEKLPVPSTEDVTDELYNTDVDMALSAMAIHIRLSELIAETTKAKK